MHEHIQDSRILAAGGCQGERIELVEGPRGLSITINGSAAPGCQWPPEQMEESIRTYLALLRHRPGEVGSA